MCLLLKKVAILSNLCVFLVCRIKCMNCLGNLQWPDRALPFSFTPQPPLGVGERHPSREDTFQGVREHEPSVLFL